MAGTTKSKGVAGNNSTILAGSSFVGWFFRPPMLFRMSLIAGVAALWPYALQRLPTLEKRPEYKLVFRQIQIHPVPERPVPQNLAEQVQAMSELPDEFSILDEHMTPEVARAFRRHPWISKVICVRKQYPAAVTVELEYRTPVAMVQVQGGRIPIDLNGVVLPSADFSAEDAGRYPLIQAATTKQELRPGMPWDDPAILAAAELANLLKDKWASLKLDAILVPRREASNPVAKDLQLELLGRGGSRILWGRAPGDQHPGELEPAQKIRRIEKYLADFADYIQPSGPYEIDIRHWQEISRHVLATNPNPVKPSKSPKEEARHQNSDARKKSRS